MQGNITPLLPPIIAHGCICKCSELQCLVKSELFMPILKPWSIKNRHMAYRNLNFVVWWQTFSLFQFWNECCKGNFGIALTFYAVIFQTWTKLGWRISFLAWRSMMKTNTFCPANGIFQRLIGRFLKGFSLDPIIQHNTYGQMLFLHIRFGIICANLWDGAASNS